MKRIALLVMMASCLCGVASADTLTWKGGSTGTFTDSANWTSDGSHTSPQPGDTCVYPNSVVTNENDAAFDIGSAGLTLRNPKTLTVKFKFTGAGLFVKQGAGALSFGVASAVSGGYRIEDGYVSQTAGGFEMMGGTSLVTLVQGAGASAVPYINIGQYSAQFSNPIKIETGRTAPASNGSIEIGNPLNTSKTFGAIEADCDFLIRNNYLSSSFKSISAPGHTVTIAQRSSGGGVLKFTQAVDANVVVMKKPVADVDSKGCIVEFSGVSTGIDNSFTVLSGTNRFAAAARWAGTNIVLKAGDRARMQFNHSDNLSVAAHLTAETGTFLEIPNGVSVTVARLTVGTTDLEPGIYTAETLKDVIVGEGSVTVVGANPHVWIGGASGRWNVASNWNPAEVPGAGMGVLITNKVSFATEAEPEDVTLSAGTLSLFARAEVNSHIRFSGPCKLAFCLAAGFSQYEKCSHTGGTSLAGTNVGNLWTAYNSKSPMGEGTIEITKGGAKGPYFWIGGFGAEYPNDFVVHGAMTNLWLQGAKTVGGAIIASNWAKLTGDITGDDDLMISQGYAVLTLTGNISVPAGKFIYLRNGNTDTYDKQGPLVDAQADIDGNLVMQGNRAVRLSGASGRPDQSLTALATTNVINTAGSWLGTNVTVSGSNAILFLKAAGNLMPYADVKVENGAKIDIASGVKVAVAELHVDGVQKPAGLYSAANLPSVITGTGKLRVGTPGVVVIFR